MKAMVLWNKEEMAKDTMCSKYPDMLENLSETALIRMQKYCKCYHSNFHLTQSSKEIDFLFFFMFKKVFQIC